MATETIEATFYLVLSQKNAWWKMGARISSTQPKLASNERVMKLSVKVPRALFQTPTLQANISLPEDAVSRPVIEASVMDNVKEVIEQQTGLKVNIVLVEPEQQG